MKSGVVVIGNRRAAMRAFGWGLALLWASVGTAAVAAGVPQLEGVKRIVFLGDSITQGGDYVTDVDCWIEAQGAEVEVLNLGLGSETASDLTAEENAGHLQKHGFGRPFVSERLARALAATKPDLLFACYGMNDGGSLSPDETGTRRFAEAVTRLRAAALQAGVKQVVLVTPPVRECKPGEWERNTADQNLTRYTAWLLSMKDQGWQVVDVHGPMRKALDTVREKNPDFGFSKDNVHPGREGHWLMASCILQQFFGAKLDGVTDAEQLFAANGAEIRKRVDTRMRALFAAWMTKIGHGRPGVAGGPNAKGGPSVADATAQAARLEGEIRALMAGDASGAGAGLSFPGETTDTWHGHKRHKFTVDGCAAWVVEPKQAAAGRPWSWCMEFPDAFTERCAAVKLLEAGFHHAHIQVGNTFGCPAAVKHFNAFYQAVTGAGLGAKPVLIGLSRGGLYAYRWAAENPGKVAAIYGDAPVCDFKSWPGGKGKGKGSKGDWAALIRCYGFQDEAKALAYGGNPVDTLGPLAKAGVPLIHVVGDSDDVVPVAENTAIVEERYRKLGGVMQVIHKPGVGHHPHGLDDPTPVVEFLLRHAGASR